MKLEFKQWCEIDYIDIGHSTKFKKEDNVLWWWMGPGNIITEKEKDEKFVHSTWKKELEKQGKTLPDHIPAGRIGKEAGSIHFPKEFSDYQKERVINDVLSHFGSGLRWWIFEEDPRGDYGISLQQWMQKRND